MLEKIEYMPRKIYSYVAMMVFLIGLGLSVFFLISVRPNDREDFFVLLIIILGYLLIAIILVLFSGLKVYFTKDAVYVQFNTKSKLKRYSYENYKFAYYCRNYKKQLFLIFSEEEIDKKRVKKIVAYGGGLGLTFYDSCVVIFIDHNNKQIDIIKEYISKTISDIHEVEWNT